MAVVTKLAKPFRFWLLLCLVLPLTLGCTSPSPSPSSPLSPSPTVLEVIELPEPRLAGEMSVEEALALRRSKRSFTEEALTWQQISQLLWAAQGITNPTYGFRVAPSAGGLYPLELYVVAPHGVYHYLPQSHQVEKLLEGDLRPELCEAAFSQSAVAEGAIDIVITALYQRTSQKYGEVRSPQYVHLEAGHAAQNILLEAVALGLGAVPIGAFYDGQVQAVLALPPDHQPLYVIPVGHPREG